MRGVRQAQKTGRLTGLRLLPACTLLPIHTLNTRSSHLSPHGLPARLPAAKKVLIVPGYGLAVASAQYAIADLVKALRKKNIEVK